MRKTPMLQITLLAVLAGAFPVRAEIAVRDNSGATVVLAAPARRVVALAPHIAEDLFAIGAGDRLVGTVDYSDYPPAAKKVPRIGGYSRVDLEAIAALKPDLVIAWRSGNSMTQVEKLRALGIPVFVTQPDRIDDVASSLERLGVLTGAGPAATAAARAFHERLEALRARYAGGPPVRVFYEVWYRPLMTVGGDQIISDAIRICGGENVFGRLAALTPTVSEESVIAADPEAIVASGMGEARPDWLDKWRRWPSLVAVTRGNLFFIPPDLIQRPTPRLLDGMEMLCKDLEQARERSAHSVTAPASHAVPRGRRASPGQDG